MQVERALIFYKRRLCAIQGRQSTLTSPSLCLAGMHLSALRQGAGRAAQVPVHVLCGLFVRAAVSPLLRADWAHA